MVETIMLNPIESIFYIENGADYFSLFSVLVHRLLIRVSHCSIIKLTSGNENSTFLIFKLIKKTRIWWIIRSKNFKADYRTVID